eukprot:CAMPEP_0116895322 /NCGR_PEP_ID=MMETSP0467-20121206/4870_1 /TAXON_ID=283647 /ORGANISM="Mesodinium pulex, Strain SPMC105" /LENGTH=71 /DNA_ID=CAMNT_0004565985 /DNA_START=135 /DNA_END=350 /DNA_ORIENTATION=+
MTKPCTCSSVIAIGISVQPRITVLAPCCFNYSTYLANLRFTSSLAADVALMPYSGLNMQSINSSWVSSGNV